MPIYIMTMIVILNLNKIKLNHLNSTIKNIPRIEIKTIIGYSNLLTLLSTIKFFDELIQINLKLILIL